MKTKNTNTKRALVSSVLSLSIFVSMFVGSTYAWFTDTATTGVNIIKSGKLEVGMNWADGTLDPSDAATVWNDAEDTENPVFNYTLWEPGFVQARHIQVENKGNLALKYNLTILPEGDISAVADLAEVIDVYTATPAVQVATREAVSALTRVGTLREVINDTTIIARATQGHLSPEQKSAVITLALKMQETAGNQYQNKKVNSGFVVKLFATQYTEEYDSIDNQYDKMATFDSTNVSEDVTLAENGASVTIPANSANINDIYELDVDDNGVSTVDGNTTAEFEITLYKNGVEIDTADIGNTEYTVKIDVGPGLHIISVKHNGHEVDTYDYNSTTGIITFTTTSFSPFTVEYHVPIQVSLNSNGGTGSMATVNAYANEAVALPNCTFANTGYSFAGWATTPTGEVAYENGDTITITAPTTLYAVWSINSYKVNVSASNSTASVTVNGAAVASGSDVEYNKVVKVVVAHTGTYTQAFTVKMGTSDVTLYSDANCSTATTSVSAGTYYFKMPAGDVTINCSSLDKDNLTTDYSNINSSTFNFG